MEQYGGYTTIRYRACFGTILFLFFRKETPPLTHSPPTPQKNAIQISEICLHFEKWKKNDNSPLRSLILFWKAATFTSERKPTVESLAWESQNDSGVKAMSYFLKWLSRLFFFFFFFFQGCFAVQSSWQCEAVPKLLVPEKWGGLCLGWAVCPPLECCWSSLRSSHGTARTQNCQHTQAKSQVRNARTCNYHAGPDERDTADWSILGFPSSLAFYHRMRRMKFASFVYLKP